MTAVSHVDLPTASVFAADQTVMTTRRESFVGPSPVIEKLKTTNKVAFWGPANDLPQRVVEDKKTYSLLPAVIKRKSDLLLQGGVRYGTVSIDETTGFEVMKPLRVTEIQDWLEDCGFTRYLREAARDWYSFANVFVEYRMGKGKNYCTGLSCIDATQTRLGVQDQKGNTTKAYVADWIGGATEADGYELSALDPYDHVADQMLAGGKFQYVLPVRDLHDGQFYYGEAEWNSLRTSGWIDVAKAIPELKRQLQKNVMILNYHIEIDERYWQIKWSKWYEYDDDQKLDLMKAETLAINEWLRSGKGKGGSWMSTMLGGDGRSDQESLVKINEKKGNTFDGAFLTDIEGSDFIVCRDMGLVPQLHGITASKTGSSAGSGSADRVLRTQHILDSKGEMDMILQDVMAPVSRINGWNDRYGNGQRLTWWCQGYYAITTDRTMQVGNMNKPDITNN